MNVHGAFVRRRSLRAPSKASLPAALMRSMTFADGPLLFVTFVAEPLLFVTFVHLERLDLAAGPLLFVTFAAEPLVFAMAKKSYE